MLRNLKAFAVMLIAMVVGMSLVSGCSWTSGSATEEQRFLEEIGTTKEKVSNRLKQVEKLLSKADPADNHAAEANNTLESARKELLAVIQKLKHMEDGTVENDHDHRSLLNGEIRRAGMLADIAYQEAFEALEREPKK